MRKSAYAVLAGLWCSLGRQAGGPPQRRLPLRRTTRAPMVSTPQSGTRLPPASVRVGTRNPAALGRSCPQRPKSSLSAERSNTTEASSSSQSTSLIGCTPATGADDPHLSSTGWAVSAHGWWNKGTCSGTTAHVTGRLYEWYTNGSSGGWVFKAKGGPTQLKRYDSGGGRVTARRNCEASTLTDWLNVVDVDVDGQIDSSNVGERKKSVYCRVW